MLLIKTNLCTSTTSSLYSSTPLQKHQISSAAYSTGTPPFTQIFCLHLIRRTQPPTPIIISSISQQKERLSTLPREILAKAISEFPLHNYLEIAHTSRHLWSVLKDNAAMICSLAIRSRYGESQVLIATLSVVQQVHYHLAFTCGHQNSRASYSRMLPQSGNIHVCMSHWL